MHYFFNLSKSSRDPMIYDAYFLKLKIFPMTLWIEMSL